MALYQIDNVASPIDFRGADRVRRVLQNAKNLLMLHMGELPFDRLRGINPALFDLPIREMREELLPELDRVMLWEPGAEVSDAEATLFEDGSVYIKVILEVGSED